MRTLKKFRFLFLSLAVCCFCACGGKTSQRSVTPAGTPDNASNALLTGKYNVEIDVQNYGVIAVTLDADAAPITVTNFINLVKEGFYDGLTFHRIYSGFMIQGGDPQGNGYGGSDKKIKGEFAANGYNNPISHTRGTISMARAKDYNSASSQFFIMHRDNFTLDGKYAAFGHVTSGMEIVDQICADAKPIDNNGSIAAKEQPVIKSIRIVE